jgi:hypothetical protein
MVNSFFSFHMEKSLGYLMMQLVNPTFSSKTKVFYVPLAKEPMGVGVAGINLARWLSQKILPEKRQRDGLPAAQKSLRRRFCKDLSARLPGAAGQSGQKTGVG